MLWYKFVRPSAIASEIPTPDADELATSIQESPMKSSDPALTRRTIFAMRTHQDTSIHALNIPLKDERSSKSIC